MSDDELTRRIIGAAIAVHRELGPGLLESAYGACLAAEFAEIGLRFVREYAVPVRYRGVELDCGYRLDFVVEDRVVVELKAVTAFEPIHQAQLLSYLRLTGRPIGLLINFNVCRLTDGIKRVVHAYQPS